MGLMHKLSQVPVNSCAVAFWTGWSFQTDFEGGQVYSTLQQCQCYCGVDTVGQVRSIKVRIHLMGQAEQVESLFFAAAALVCFSSNKAASSMIRLEGSAELHQKMGRSRTFRICLFRIQPVNHQHGHAQTPGRPASCTPWHLYKNHIMDHIHIRCGFFNWIPLVYVQSKANYLPIFCSRVLSSSKLIENINCGV